MNEKIKFLLVSNFLAYLKPQCLTLLKNSFVHVCLVVFSDWCQVVELSIVFTLYFAAYSVLSSLNWMELYWTYQEECSVFGTVMLF